MSYLSLRPFPEHFWRGRLWTNLGLGPPWPISLLSLAPRDLVSPRKMRRAPNAMECVAEINLGRRDIAAQESPRGLGIQKLVSPLPLSCDVTPLYVL